MSRMLYNAVFHCNNFFTEILLDRSVMNQAYGQTLHNLTKVNNACHGGATEKIIKVLAVIIHEKDNK